MKKPSKRAVRISTKVLKSDGVAPARLQVKEGDFWTLQWSELRVLALAVKNSEGRRPLIPTSAKVRPRV